MKAFEDYLHKKMFERGVELGRFITAREFAEWLGFSATTYSSWVNGGSVPSLENLIKLSSRLGDEVYEAAGYQRPDISPYSLPDGLRSKLESFVSELSEAVKDVPDGSPEQARIVKSLMDKFGLTLIENKADEATK